MKCDICKEAEADFSIETVVTPISDRGRQLFKERMVGAKASSCYDCLAKVGARMNDVIEEEGIEVDLNIRDEE